MTKNKASRDARLKTFHDFTLKLVELAEKGRFISDYYRDIAPEIIEYSRCSSLNFLTNDAGVYYRLSFNTDPEGGILKEELSLVEDNTDAALESDQDAAADLAGTSAAVPGTVSVNDQLEVEGIEAGTSLQDLEKKVYLGRANEYGLAAVDGGLYFTAGKAGKIAGGYSSLLILPMQVPGKTVGVISLAWKGRQGLEAEEIELFQYMCNLIASARTHRKARFLLGERIKELQTIYKIARLGSEIDKSLDYVLAGAADIIPRGFLHSEQACCRIVYANKTFTSDNYEKPAFFMSEDILTDGTIKGFVEVGYKEEPDNLAGNPFLKEEQPLLRALAGELGYIAERKHFEEERERLQQQLLHADRLATVGQLTAGVAHELNEPLGGILGFAQLIKKYGEINESVEKDIDKIIKASLHGREIIRKLMLFSRQTPPEKALVNINERIDDGLYLLESRIKKSKIVLCKEFAHDLPPIKIDPSQLNQVLVNLVVNAIQAMPDGGKLLIKTESSIDSILLIIQDTGVGMSGEQIDKIFIPFYTTKGINEGVGLGLPVALGIVQSHRGTISVESEPGKGTRFTVKLPIEGDTQDG